MKEKNQQFFWKIRPYKQRREEIFEKLGIQNYDEKEINKSDQQNEHIIIVADTEDLPNNTKENVTNFLSVNFFLPCQGLTNEIQPNQELITHPRVFP